jgi:hypothetical protein
MYLSMVIMHEAREVKACKPLGLLLKSRRCHACMHALELERLSLTRAQHMDKLIQDQYGNYVVQHVLEHGPASEVTRVLYGEKVNDISKGISPLILTLVISACYQFLLKLRWTRLWRASKARSCT